MVDIIISIRETWSSLWENTGFFVLFVISVVYLFYMKDKKTFDLFVLFCGGIFLVFFNPLVYYILVIAMDVENFYTRIPMCIPMAIVISYAAMSVVMKKKDETQETPHKYIILLILIIMLSGRCIYRDSFNLAENVYHIPQEAVDIGMLIEEHEGTNDLKNVTIAMPNYPAARYVRLYNASYKSPFGRRGWASTGEEAKQLYDLLCSKSSNYDMILTNAYVCNCNYIVVFNDVPQVGFLEQGCVVVGYTDNYVVYCIDTYETEVKEVIDKREEYIEKWY